MTFFGQINNDLKNNNVRIEIYSAQNKTVKNKNK